LVVVARYFLTLAILVIPLFSANFICKDEQMSLFINPTEDILIGASPIGTYLINKRTIKKLSAEVVTVWETLITTRIGQDEMVKMLGSKWNRYGYQKMLVKYDFKNNKKSIISIAHYECTGKPIRHNDYQDDKWSHIIPGSIADTEISVLREVILQNDQN